MRTYALYRLPDSPDDFAQLHAEFDPVGSARATREKRKELHDKGIHVAIHVAEDGKHPDFLPKGETLWVEDEHLAKQLSEGDWLTRVSS